jgi:hypothetical protein
MTAAITHPITVVSHATLASGTARILDAVTPERALDHLSTIASGVRDGVVLGADGRRLAGNRDLAAPARALLAAAGDAPEIEVATGRGTVYAVRSGRRAIAVVAERGSLPALMLFDLRVTVGELATR